jgi:hypothetical protein
MPRSPTSLKPYRVELAIRSSMTTGGASGRMNHTREVDADAYSPWRLAAVQIASRNFASASAPRGPRRITSSRPSSYSRTSRTVCLGTPGRRSGPAVHDRTRFHGTRRSRHDHVRCQRKPRRPVFTTPMKGLPKSSRSEACILTSIPSGRVGLRGPRYRCCYQSWERRVQRRFPCLRHPTLAIRPQGSFCVHFREGGLLGASGSPRRTASQSSVVGRSSSQEGSRPVGVYTFPPRHTLNTGMETV